MEPLLLQVFQHQVLTQCEFILLAAEEVQAALQADDTTRVFYGLQNVLNAAANVSKALWGQRGKRAAQRQELRASLGIADDSPLRGVLMRNNFEHFDERVDVWWRTSKRHIYIDGNIGAKATMPASETVELFRHFDPATTILYFWNQEFHITAILAEVSTILRQRPPGAGPPPPGPS